MLKLLQTSDFEMISKDQTENLKFFEISWKNLDEVLKSFQLTVLDPMILREKPFLEICSNIRLKLKRHLIAKKDNIKLSLKKCPILKEIFTVPSKINFIKPLKLIKFTKLIWSV